MKGLILKDFIALRKYAKQFLLIAGLFLIMAVMIKSPSYIAFMFMFFGSMSIITSISYDETVGWNKYAFSMPVNKREIVLAKYTSWLLLSLATGIVSMLAGGIMCFLFKMSFREFIVSQIAVSCIYLMMFAILIPFLFKLGVEKGRIVMIGIVLIPAAFVMIAEKVLKGMNSKIDLESIVEKGIYMLPILTIILIVVSYFASVKIMTQKEW